MAIAFEFINCLVPRSAIERRYPGGWTQCLRDHAPFLGGRVYYDDHLFHDGAMGPGGIDLLSRQWSAQGFLPKISVNGREVSNDVCVIDVVGGKLWPCEWVAHPSAFVAHLAGTKPGRLVGPRSARHLIAARLVARDLKKIAKESAGPAVHPTRFDQIS